MTVKIVADFNIQNLESLLHKYQLSLICLSKHDKIPGSYWGDSEAGIIKNTLFVRPDTPIHSLLHEACHYICMDSNRRLKLDTDAEGDYDEENAVCYLQILLAEELQHMGSERMMIDMDSWGYTFRLGSAKDWFDQDAEDTLHWLQKNKLLGNNNLPNYKIREN